MNQKIKKEERVDVDDAYYVGGVEISAYERALSLQRESIKLHQQKIDSQRIELARMMRVYSQNVESTKISEAVKFLYQVIINKIKNLWR